MAAGSVELMPTKEELQHLYWDKQLTLDEIGRIYGVSRWRVVYWMKKYGIRRRSNREAKKLFFRKHVVPRCKRCGRFLGPKPHVCPPRDRYKKFSNEDFLRLYNQGLSDTEIARRLNVAAQSVRERRIKLGLPSHNRPTKNIVDLTPTYSLGYVVGVMKGDGCHYVGKRKNGTKFHLFFLFTTSRQFAERFAEHAAKVLCKPKKLYIREYQPKQPRRHLRYEVRFTSKDFATWYTKLTYDKIFSLAKQSKEFAKGFIEGFTDSEGHVYQGRSSRCIAVYNTDKQLLILYKRIIEEIFGLHMTRIYISNITSKNRPCYVVQISYKDGFYRFLTMFRTIKAGGLRGKLVEFAGINDSQC